MLLRLAAVGLAVGIMAMSLPGKPRAEEVTPAIAERLTPEQLNIYEQYRKVRGAFDRQHQAYWRAVDAKRRVGPTDHLGEVRVVGCPVVHRALGKPGDLPALATVL